MKSRNKTGGRKSYVSVLLKALTVATVASLAIAGCSSGSKTTSKSTTGTKSGPAAGAKASANGQKIFVIGGADAFFSVVKNGADVAGKSAKEAGNSYTWIPLPTYDNIGPDMAKLIQSAVSQGATALALPDWAPAAENPEIKAAVSKGIKVVLYNAGGAAQVKATGALAYFGTDEFTAGKKAGEYLGAHGAKNAVCVNTSPGSINIEDRCKGTAAGMAESGGKSKELVLPGKSFGDAAAISNAVKGALQQDTKIDAVMTISSADSDAAAVGITAAGSKAMSGSFDISANILNRIKAGTQLFAVDQLGWLQGYDAVSAVWQVSQWGILPATNIVLTGPSLVTKDNVDVITSGVKTGQR